MQQTHNPSLQPRPPSFHGPETSVLEAGPQGVGGTSLERLSRITKDLEKL